MKNLNKFHFYNKIKTCWAIIHHLFIALNFNCLNKSFSFSYFIQQTKISKCPCLGKS